MRNIVAVIAFALILTACAGTPNPAPVQTSAQTAAPPATPTVQPTQPPTPVPQLETITSANVSRLQTTLRIGRGTGADLAWLPDGNVAVLYGTGLTVFSPTGVFVRSAEPATKAVASDSAMSADGKHVVSLVDNKTLLVWDANTGRIEQQFETNCGTVHEDLTRKVAFSTDGSQIAGCDEGGVSVWDLSKAERRITLRTKNPVPGTVLFSPTGDSLIVASSRKPGSYNGLGDVEILDLTTGKVLEAFKCKQEFMIAPIAISHATNVLALSQTGKDVTLIDLASRKTLKTLQVQFTGIYPGSIYGIGFSTDDKTVAASGNYYAGTILLDIESGKAISHLDHIAANILKFGPTGRYFAAGLDGYGIFATLLGTTIAWLGDFKSYPVMEFDPKGRFIAAGGSLMALWDLEKGSPAFPEILPWGTAFAFAPHDRGLITNAWNDRDWNHKVTVYDLLGGEHPVEDLIPASSNDLIQTPKACPSGYCAAIGIGGRYIQMVSLTTFSLSNKLQHSAVSDYEFSPDGKTLASSGSGIVLWDFNAGTSIRKMGGSTPIFGLSFSPDGTLIAGGVYGQGVQVWKTATAEPVSKFAENKYAARIAFSSNGKLLAALGYDPKNHAILCVWDFATGKLLYRLDGSLELQAPMDWYGSHGEFLFSPDGSIIAIKGFGDHAEFIDAVSGSTLKTLDDFKAIPVEDAGRDTIAFSAKGDRFAVAGSDGIIRILTVAP